MPRVLVVDGSTSQSAQVARLLTQAGYQVEVASQGQAALDRLQRDRPDLIVTGLDVPDGSGLQFVEAAHRCQPRVPIILVTSPGNEDVAALALHAGATSYVPQANVAHNLVATVADVLSVAEAAPQEPRVLEGLIWVETHFVLPNEHSVVSPVIAHLENTLVALRFGDATERLQVVVALREALLNAMDHGNLEVGSELREGDESDYHEVLQQRRQQSPYRDRRVHLQARMSGSEVVFVVGDEGSGFDPACLLDPTDPANLERIGGRGLLLMRTFMDEVRYNDRGNEVTLAMRLGRQP